MAGHYQDDSGVGPSLSSKIQEDDPNGDSDGSINTAMANSDLGDSQGHPLPPGPSTSKHTHGLSSSPTRSTPSKKKSKTTSKKEKNFKKDSEGDADEGGDDQKDKDDPREGGKMGASKDDETGESVHSEKKEREIGWH